MKKYIAFIATFLFFASVTVFTLPMMQNDANADLSLTEKVTIMANAGDGGDGDEDGSVECYCTHWFFGRDCKASGASQYHCRTIDPDSLETCRMYDNDC